MILCGTLPTRSEQHHTQSNRMKSPVLIIQTSQAGLALTKKSLKKAGLIEDQDFVITDNPTSLESQVIADTPQLLITGMFNGDGIAATAFVQKMKRVNTKLKAGAFSSGDILSGEPYDVMLHKGIGVNFAQTLVDAVKNFLTAK